jgi:hypothetical protein
VTSPRRTIEDLRIARPSRGGANPEQLRRALRQADLLGLPVDEPLPDGTRSDLELGFLEICRRHRLPPPEVNSIVDDIEVDFLWRARRVIVEPTAGATTAGVWPSKTTATARSGCAPSASRSSVSPKRKSNMKRTPS